jgi:hypothetical protein
MLATQPKNRETPKSGPRGTAFKLLDKRVHHAKSRAGKVIRVTSGNRQIMSPGDRSDQTIGQRHFVPPTFQFGGGFLNRVRKHICIQQEAHSLISRGNSRLRLGIRTPFTGQARSQSANPSFGCRVILLSTIAPGCSSSVMISRSSPGHRFCCFRTLGGMTTCPLLLKVVFMATTCRNGQQSAMLPHAPCPFRAIPQDLCRATAARAPARHVPAFFVLSFWLELL